MVDKRTEKEKRIQALQGRILAFHYAGEDEKAGPDVETLVQLLSDENEDSNVRYAAASAMRWARPEAKTVIEPLLRALQDKDVSVQHIAGESLLSLNLRDNDSILGPLLRALEDKEKPFSVRFYAAAAIGRVGPKAELAIEPLIRALGDKDWRVRRITAEALASIGPRAKSAIGPLIEILNDQGNNDWVRSNAVLALAALGPETEVVVEALSSALSDPSEKVRSAAKQTLQTIMSKT
jgi:HEAT repeat protein